MTRLPPLAQLRAFEAAARLRSFSEAGRELNVSHAAISRLIRAYCASLRVTVKCRLVERTLLSLSLRIACSTGPLRIAVVVCLAVKP